MTNIRQEYYSNLIREDKIEVAKLQKKITRITIFRFTWFCSIIATTWLCRGVELWIPIAESIAGIVGFLALVKYNNKLLLRQEFIEKRITIVQRELNLIDYCFDGLDGAKEEIDFEHPFANDLDLFGNHSLFQYINRSIAGLGREKLISWLKTPHISKEEIYLRQKATEELSQREEFRLNFATTGALHPGSAEEQTELLSFFYSPNLFLHKKGLTLLLKLLPIITTTTLVAAMAELIPYSLFTLMFLVNLCITGIYTKQVNSIHNLLGKTFSILSIYEKLLALINHERLNEKKLIELQKSLHKEMVDPTILLRRLNRQAEHLDQRSNYLVSIFLNGTLLWDLRTILSIEQIKHQTAALLPNWFETLSYFDALCSLATFRYNHPEYQFPEIDDTNDLIEIKEMGHPLIHRSRCVQNDLLMPTSPYLIIVTGANMAGKSTYLRTLGTNYLLACIGAPVCASKMKFRPTNLCTSLRTTDSLAKNESYFFAELKRLQTLIQRLEKGEKVFIILDEILKGTNSTDKQKGSLALVARLLNLGGTGIIATHDLLLGSLAEAFPTQVTNFRFEAEIKDDTLSFSYKMKPGIAQNMNACFLMEKMGIIE